MASIERTGLPTRFGGQSLPVTVGDVDVISVLTKSIKRLGSGHTFWPRPGRVFAAARTHTFTHLGDAIDTAFARWDRSHLTLFHLPDGSDLFGPIRWEDPWEGSRFAGDQKLSRLAAGEQCTYTFDMRDDWTHLCMVAEQRIDPLDTLGVIPAVPLPYWGWGQIPDQYGA